MRNLIINPEVFDVEYDENIIFEEFEDDKVKFQLGLLGEDRYPGINILINNKDVGPLITGDSLVYMVGIFNQIKTKTIPIPENKWLHDILSKDWVFKEQN